MKHKLMMSNIYIKYCFILSICIYSACTISWQILIHLLVGLDKYWQWISHLAFNTLNNYHYYNMIKLLCETAIQVPWTSHIVIKNFSTVNCWVRGAHSWSFVSLYTCKKACMWAHVVLVTRAHMTLQNISIESFWVKDLV